MFFFMAGGIPVLGRPKQILWGPLGKSKEWGIDGCCMFLEPFQALCHLGVPEEMEGGVGVTALPISHTRR